MKNKIENREPKSEKIEVDNKSKSFLKTVYLVLVVILGISLLTMWIMDSSKYKQLERTSKEEQSNLIAKTDQIIKERDMSSLMLLMKPLVWAVRAEMLRDNMDQVNQYAYNMVKEKNFQLVIIISNTGKVISATDKKLEETQFDANFDNEFLKGNEVMSKSIDSNLIAISAPIMGYDNRLGTLFVTYTPEIYDLNTPEDSVQ